MLDITAHFVLSSLLGFGFWLFFDGKDKRRLLYCLGFALLSGFLVDLDHFFDYFMAYGFVWNFSHFIHEDFFNASGHNYVFFHAFEYVILLGLSAFLAKKKWTKIYLSILAVSLLGHLFIDIYLAGATIRSYFIIYRILTGFIT
jgi:hypothetical protein